MISNIHRCVLAAALLAAACNKSTPEDPAATPSAKSVAVTPQGESYVDRPEYRFKLPPGSWKQTDVPGKGVELDGPKGMHVTIRVLSVPDEGDTRSRVEKIIESRRKGISNPDSGVAVTKPVYEEVNGVLRGRFFGLDEANAGFLSFLVAVKKSHVISVSYYQPHANGPASAAETNAIIAFDGLELK